MKKLLQINIVSNMLSTGNISEDIAKVARKRGWDCYIAYGRKSVSGISKEIKVGSVFDMYEHYFENRIFDNEGLASRRATLRLIDRIKEIQPDVVHLHNIHDHYLNYKIMFHYLNNSKISVVWTFHDFWAITGHCHHFIEANCEKWKAECDHCPLQHSTVNSVIDRSKRNFQLKKKLFTENKNLTIVAVSNWVGELVTESFLKEKRILVIPNGIDMESFKQICEPKHLSLPDDKFIIISVAKNWGWGDRKGLDGFVALSKMLGSDEVIVLVGMNQDLINQMPNNIIGLEKISSKEELAILYSKADVMLSLSLAETFGLTIVEANACGTPAVVYDNTAPPSLLSSNTGYVAKNGDIEDAYQKIELIKSRGKSAYSMACIEHAEKYYNKDINYQKYIDLYETLITEQNA